MTNQETHRDQKQLIGYWSVVFQVHQVEMEGVVRGIQADMTKLSKSHSHTSNTVSKLLDKSRKLSVTMKEVKYLTCDSTHHTCH